MAIGETTLDPLWLSVESGARCTTTMAINRFPKLTEYLIGKAQVPFQWARKPAMDGQRPMHVKTFATEDIEALVTQPAQITVDPLWAAVDSGARLTAKTAIERFPKLTKASIHGAKLPFSPRRFAPI